MTRTTPRRLVAAIAVPLILTGPVVSAGAKDPLLYVSNEIPNTISVVSLRTNGVIATIPVGKRPRGMALSPDRRTVYVALGQDDALGVVDVATAKMTETIPANRAPELGVLRPVAFSPAGARAWVSAEAGGNVTIIDVATDSVLGQFPIRDGKTKPVRIAFSPDGRLAYITEGAAGSVSVVDVARQAVIDSI